MKTFNKDKLFDLIHKTLENVYIYYGKLLDINEYKMKHIYVTDQENIQQFIIKNKIHDYDKLLLVYYDNNTKTYGIIKNQAFLFSKNHIKNLKRIETFLLTTFSNCQEIVEANPISINDIENLINKVNNNIKLSKDEDNKIRQFYRSLGTVLTLDQKSKIQENFLQNKERDMGSVVLSEMTENQIIEWKKQIC